MRPLKFKPLQIEVEIAKAWRFEHRCLIWRFCWSFLPSGMASDFSIFDATFWYYKTQYRKRHWLEMLYRKDDLSGRVLLFFNDAKNDSATALSCGLPGWEKDCFVLYLCKSCWNRWEVYCAPRSLWKIRPDGGWRSSCAILNVAVRSWVLFFFETLCAITLREKRSMITQI